MTIDTELLFQIASGIVVVASIVVSTTPTPMPGTWLSYVYSVIESLALVFGRAKEEHFLRDEILVALARDAGCVVMLVEEDGTSELYYPEEMETEDAYAKVHEASKIS